MTDQAAFDFSSPANQLARDWREYHANDPEVYRLFIKFTMEAIQHRRKHYSARAIIECIRWETEVRGGKDFKIPNAHTAFYSRLFMMDVPQHANFFRCAESAADEEFSAKDAPDTSPVDAIF